MQFNFNKKLFGMAAALLTLPVVASCGQQTAQVPAGDSTVETQPNVAASPDSTTSTESTTASNDVVSVVAGNPSLSMLASAIQDAGLAETLKSGGPYTIFAPSDQAFAALPEAARQELMQPENQDVLRQLLSYHVVSGNLTSDQLGSSQVQSLEGTPLSVDVNQGTNEVKINNATVTQADIPASNGVIHVVDQVILPPNVSMK